MQTHTRPHARNMARTLCAGISNQAKDQFYRDNQDIIPQVEWLDTLDGRTCPSCAGLSRQRYNTEEPHPVPPLHPQCRCVLIPVTELTDLGEDVPRAAANADFDAEAKRMYEEKYPQKHFEDLAPSTREQNRHKAIHEYEERTGKPAFTRAPGSMTFAEFFEQSSEQFKKDWLKPGKYALYKSGKYPITAFIPPHPDRAFGVKQLKEMDIKSFRTGTVYQASGFIKRKSVGIIADTQADFPEGYEYQPLKSYYDAAQKGEKEFIKKLREKSPEKEVIAVWDADTGKVHCVAMGVHNKVTFEYPEPNAIAIHNHPEGTTPSLQDFNIFASGRMKKMQIITKEGSFVLTSSGGDAILDIEEINKRFHKISGEERDSISFDEWEKVLEGSQYAIQNIPHRNN